MTLPVQVNGKRRAEIVGAGGLGRRDHRGAGPQPTPAVQRALNGAAPRRLIVVPDRIVNVVV